MPLLFLVLSETCSSTSTEQTQMFPQPCWHAWHWISVLFSTSDLCSFTHFSYPAMFSLTRDYFCSAFLQSSYIVIYLLTFFLPLMVLLLTLWYHKRLNTSVYMRCPSGFLLYPAWKFCIFEIIPRAWKNGEKLIIDSRGTGLITKMNETLGSKFSQF